MAGIKKLGHQLDAWLLVKQLGASGKLEGSAR